jgi:hypothetical protein
MDEFVLAVEALPQDRAHAHQITGRKVRNVREIILGIDDGVEIAAIGDVHRDLAQTFAVCLDTG